MRNERLSIRHAIHDLWLQPVARDNQSDRTLKEDCKLKEMKHAGTIFRARGNSHVIIIF